MSNGQVPANYCRDTESSRLLLVIGVAKIVKAAFFVCLGLGARRLSNSADGAYTIFAWAARVRVDPDNRFIHYLLSRISFIDERKLELISVGTWIYAALFALEGVGLVLRRRWAEWLTVVVTGLLVPVELYEIHRHPHLGPIVILVLNILVVVYLVHRLRVHGRKLCNLTGMTTWQRNRLRARALLQRTS